MAWIRREGTVSEQFILIDEPRPSVRRITLNRPEKRNAMHNGLRTELFAALEAGDRDPAVKVMVLRGAGPCFSSGYDLQSNPKEGQPWHTAGGYGNWARHVVEGCFRVWDLAKPVIAQVHGYCLAGGSELATACDLVYVADDAQVGYPPVRVISPPDNQFFPWLLGMRRAMELMLTGDPMTGAQAAEWGFANRAFPADELEDRVLEIAERVAKAPTDLQQINKRALHRQMDAMGIRAGIRAGTEMQMLATFTEGSREHLKSIKQGSLTEALSKRDEAYGDYRTSGGAAS